MGLGREIWNLSLDGGQFSGALLLALKQREQWPKSLKLVVWEFSEMALSLPLTDDERAVLDSLPRPDEPRCYSIPICSCWSSCPSRWPCITPWGRSTCLAALWLCLTSIVFYGWWNPQFVVLLAGSIAFNYAVSQLILHSEGRPRLQGLITGLGVGADLALLFHYKYFAALLGFQ